MYTVALNQVIQLMKCLEEQSDSNLYKVVLKQLNLQYLRRMLASNAAVVIPTDCCYEEVEEVEKKELERLNTCLVHCFQQID